MKSEGITVRDSDEISIETFRPSNVMSAEEVAGEQRGD